MRFSRATQYTLQALLFMAGQPEGRLLTNREIAEHLDLPLHYLAKLMSGLGQTGWIDSQRGKQGGYRLNEDVLDLSLLSIVRSIENEGSEPECLLGLKQCGNDDACVLHCQWRPIREEVEAQLGAQTLRQIVSSGHPLPAGNLIDDSLISRRRP